MNAFNIGLSSMSASQRALDLIGQNLANVGTPGYHRQSVVLSPRVLGGEVGSGVEIKSVMRYRSEMIERSMTVNRYQTGRINVELDTLRQVEAIFTPGTGTVSDLADKLFNQFEQLAARPDDTAQRRVVVNTAANFAGQLNKSSGELAQIRSGLRQRIDDAVGQINQYSEQLANFNRQIHMIERTGGQANELRDQRDQMLNDLANLSEVRFTELPFGVVNVLVGSAPVVTGSTFTTLQAQTDTAGQVYVALQGSTTPLSVTSGSLGGQISLHNEILTDYEPRLDEFARQVAQQIDSVQSTGIGLKGPQTSALGARDVDSATAPLATAGTDFPVQAGSTWFSVTDQSTGQHTLHEVVVDPATQSLQDVATAITTATSGRVQASITTDNRLQLQAQAGFSFDMAGRVPSTPENVSMGGTAMPMVSGIYQGTVNGSYSFQVAGTGTVGVTPNLILEVRDVSNNVVASVNVGQGYTPGSPIAVGNGLQVRIGAGSVSGGTFNVPVLAMPDSAGLLSALGVNGLFSGSSAIDLKVRPEVMTDPSLLAASRDGQPGDSSNLIRLAGLRDQRLMNGGTETFRENLARIVGDVGASVKTSQDQQTALEALSRNLFAQQQSVSGVDPNEEVANMLQFQRSFQMAARYISSVNTALDDLLNILR
jgi:flagellar hook-associated protein 1 FlgK